MSKKQKKKSKKNKQDNALTKIVLLTAILQLAQATINLIEKWLD